MTDDKWAAEKIDTSVSSIARSYDAFLGGKDNFEVDRELAQATLEIVPEMGRLAVWNRQWLSRVVQWLAREVGIGQFLDVGCGLPTQENTHQVAQRVRPEARVLYVDNDPTCVAHARVLLEDNECTRFVEADLTRPEELLQHPVVRKHLNFEEPIGLIQCGTFHHIPDEAGPYEIMAAYVDALPSGSYAAVTHFWDPEDNGEVTAAARQIEQAWRSRGFASGFWRPKDQIQRLFSGLEIVEPGLVPLYQWWPDGPRIRELTRGDHLMIGGVGRKP